MICSLLILFHICCAFKDTMNNKLNTPLRKTPNSKSTPIASASATRRRVTDKSETNLLNTAFNSKLTKTPTTASTPNSARFKPKSTTLNACYTPSSLYRNTAKSTPKTLALSITPSRSATKNRLLVKSGKKSVNPTDSQNTEISNLTVAVRVRPLNAQECSRVNVSNVVRVKGHNELTVQAGVAADSGACVTHCFNYDHVFYSCDPKSRNYATQQHVFAETARPLIDRAFEGYNACLFAYGQTGSGKSYSMMGIEALDDAALDGHAPHPEAGIIPRFCHELFRRISAVKHVLQAEIEVSYFEIYNEKIHDLLSVQSTLQHAKDLETPLTHMRPALKVREHPIWGPYVVDLSVHPVDSYEALRNWLAVGNSQRATAATGMNDKSSRSHSIFNIVLNLTEMTPTPSGSDSESSGSYASAKCTVSDEGSLPRQTRRSKISLVDLAGSERIANNGHNEERIREGVCINKSLLTLGKVIAALADAKRVNNNATICSNNGTGSNSNVFVPYRESVLTWLLRESLGGNSKTVMLATISPASIHVDETLATLRYACQARTIVNRVKVNESPHDKIIRELRAEVDRLKSLRNEYERQSRISASHINPTPRKIIIETSVDESEVEALKQQLAERERELAQAQKSWMERLQEAENLRQSEMRLLRRRGLALEFSIEHKQACLVNLTADPILSGTLFYMLPVGKVKIGRTRNSQYCSQPDIVLDGPLVGYHHCIIENVDGKLFVIPENEDFETFLNGELVLERTQMYHGDRLVIGGSHYFRISNPFCTNKNENKLVDFECAHREILHKQEEKLRRELEEEKRLALLRIEREREEYELNFQNRLQKFEFEQLKFDCNREILETEKRALAEQAAAAHRRSTESSVTPSKSHILDEIKRIMQTPSEKCLHKTQLMVKEATQRCRSLGLSIEFRQSQMLDEYGMMRTVVLIVDKAMERKAQWPVARLGVWLDIVRDQENLTAKNVFDSVDLNWESIEPNDLESLNDTLNSSRISLNLSPYLAKSPQPQNSLKKTALLNSRSENILKGLRKKKLLYDDEADLISNNSNISQSSDLSPVHYKQSFTQVAVDHVRDLQRVTLRLKRLCEHHCGKENLPNERSVERHIYNSVEQLEDVLLHMRDTLEQNQNDTSPSKTPKSVRFLID